MATDRINTLRHVTAMAALDTVDMLADRVENLLRHGRRMTMARRYTYVDQPPELTAGLTVDGKPHRWSKDDGAGFTVRLNPGLLTGFGFAAYANDGSATEAEAWMRYHAAEAVHGDWSRRRRDMTLVEITGGLPGDGPARDDKLVIRYWNRDGVCDEVVVAFDYDTGSAAEQGGVR